MVSVEDYTKTIVMLSKSGQTDVDIMALSRSRVLSDDEAVHIYGLRQPKYEE